MVTGVTTTFAVRRTTWVYILAAWTLYGLVHASLWTLGHSEPAVGWKYIFPSALAVAWSWALLTPVVFAAARTFAPARVGWATSVVAHALGALIVALVMTGIRLEAIAFFSGYDRPSFAPNFAWWMDVWVFVYITLVVIGNALDAQRRYADRTLRASLLEGQLARTQLQYLESQLQPHFLFNALNTIQELAHEAPAASERMLRRLRALLTLSLERHGQDEVALSDELAALEPYLDIQRTRFSNWLSVDVDVPADAREVRVPHLVLQPLVENAIRHGLAVRKGPGHIRIQGRRTGDTLVLRVEDDGAGLREGAGPGIGLTNVMERLKQLYGSEQSLRLGKREPQGTLVEIRLPWRTAPQTPPPERAWPVENADWRTGEFAARPVPATPTSGQQVPGRADAGDVATTPVLSWKGWLGITGVWLVLAVFWTNQFVLMTRMEPRSSPLNLWEAASAQLAGSAVWLVLSLPALWMARRFRFAPGNWPQRLPVHLVAATACGFVHVGVLTVGGFSSAPVLSMSSLNPLTGDFFIYLGLLAWSHARDFVARFRAREIETAQLSAQIARSRFQAMRVQLRPEFVLATLEYLEGLVHTNAERAERLIARLADVLRCTLDVSRIRATTVDQEMQLVEACVETHRLGVRPGIHLRAHVEGGAGETLVPSRLICATVDELLANAVVLEGAELTLSVEAIRVSGYTRITVRAEGAAEPRGGRGHSWWHRDGVAERAVESADATVSVLVPDRHTVMLMVGGDGVMPEEPAMTGEVLMMT